MTKEELCNRWIDWFHEDYILTGDISEDKENFAKDLEAWYESQHIKELNHIKAGVIKSFAEINTALKEVAKNEKKHRKECVPSLCATTW